MDVSLQPYFMYSSWNVQIFWLCLRCLRCFSWNLKAFDKIQYNGAMFKSEQNAIGQFAYDFTGLFRWRKRNGSAERSNLFVGLFRRFFGSIFGPMFFFIYTNDLSKGLHRWNTPNSYLRGEWGFQKLAKEGEDFQ